MEKKIRVLLAFDHEVPLGSISTSYKEAIFDPTDNILALAAETGIKINLFTDILCNNFFKKHGEFDFCGLYESQLQKTLRYGHDVQLHIHPHWINSGFQNKIFEPSSSYKLSDFKDGAYPDNIYGIIEQGILNIDKICRPVKNDYQCIAYRAGGYNLEPETELILSALFQLGIRIDSSIAKGLYFKTDYSHVDYKKMPEDCNWYISPKGNIRHAGKDGIFEIPIATIKAGLRTNLLHTLRKAKYKKRAFYSGKTIYAGKMKLIDKLRFVFSVRMLGFDLHTLSSGDLMKILEHNVRRYSSGKEIILSTVSHPKNMGPYSLKLMKEFVDKTREKYKDAVEFTTFTDIYRSKLTNQVI
jgi:hypothetical protein